MSGTSHIVQPGVLCCKGRAGLSGWRDQRYKCFWPGSQPRNSVAPGTPQLAPARLLAVACRRAVSALLPASARYTCAATLPARAPIGNNPFSARLACIAHQSCDDTQRRLAAVLFRALPAIGEEPGARAASPSNLLHPANRTPAAIQHDPVLRLITNPEVARVSANWIECARRAGAQREFVASLRKPRAQIPIPRRRGIVLYKPRAGSTIKPGAHHSIRSDDRRAIR